MKKTYLLIICLTIVGLILTSCAKQRDITPTNTQLLTTITPCTTVKATDTAKLTKTPAATITPTPTVISTPTPTKAPTKTPKSTATPAPTEVMIEFNNKITYASSSYGGIDFLVFDTTNSTGHPTSTGFTASGGGNNTYISAAINLIKILDEYYQKGHNVPKIVFYTNSNSGGAMSVIHNKVYKKHPEYSHLWFNWDSKPMIIGKSNEASQEV